MYETYINNVLIYVKEFNLDGETVFVNISNNEIVKPTQLIPMRQKQINSYNREIKNCKIPLEKE